MPTASIDRGCSRVFGLTVSLVYLCLWFPSPARTQQTEVKPHLFNRAVTLTIGIERYRFLPEAKFAENDARAVGDLFRDLYGFTPDTSLIGTQATKRNILAKLDEYAVSLGEQDVLIVFFAGHGQVINLPVERNRPPMREGFLVPYEARLALDDHRNPDVWRREAIGMHELLDRVQAMRARHVLVIADACCSGFMTTRGSIKHRPDLQFLLNNPSRAVLAATTDNQIATPDPARGQGHFTAALLDELRSWSERKEAASLTDVFENIRFQVARSTRQGMIPQMNSRLGSGNGELVFLPKSVRQSDVAYVARLVREPPSNPEGRGHVLSGVLERAQERENLKTTEAEVIEAFEAANYRFSTDAPARDQLWRGRVERYREQAAAGDVLAMAALHYCYSKALGVDQPDPATAHRWARTAYESEQPVGKHVLARCLLNGIGTEKNEIAAWQLIGEAAEAGFSVSQCALAMHLIGDMAHVQELEEDKLTQARSLAERAATAGVAQSKEQLALLYLFAGPLPGMRRDVPRGVELLREAADAGLPSAQAELAKILAGALPDPPADFPVDLEKSKTYLTRAAESGHPIAQHILANEYLQDEHVGQPTTFGFPRDLNRARRFLELAANQDFTPSLMTLSEIHENGIGGPVDFPKAQECCERAAKLGATDALVTQGRWYRDGRIYHHDDFEAMRFFLSAAEQGNPVGCRMAGLMLDDARGVDLGGHPRREMEPYLKFRALHWYVQAVRLGNDVEARKQLDLFHKDYTKPSHARNEREGYYEYPQHAILDDLRESFPESGDFFDKLYGIDPDD